MIMFNIRVRRSSTADWSEQVIVGVARAWLLEEGQGHSGFRLITVTGQVIRSVSAVLRVVHGRSKIIEDLQRLATTNNTVAYRRLIPLP